MNADVASAYRESFALPTSVDNDANAGLLAEASFGAATGDDVVYLNGSTSGIGASVLSGGRLLRGAQGFAGELGHTEVTPGGRPCRCGRSGCLETEVNLENLGTAAGVDRLDPESLENVLAPPRSASVNKEVDRQIAVLARGIADAVSSFNPGVVVLGGFLGALFDVRSEELTAAVTEESFTRLATGTVIVRATLREKRLMIGGGEVAFAALMDDPAGWTEPVGR
jgi:predicted NBD/HSP70 family sugar kinase